MTAEQVWVMDIITTGTKKYIILSICAIMCSILVANLSFAERVSQSDTKFQQYSQDITITNTTPRELYVTQYNTYPMMSGYNGTSYGYDGTSYEQGFADMTNPYYGSSYNCGNQFYNSGLYPLTMMYLLNHMNGNPNTTTNNTQVINTLYEPTNYSLKKK